jgi:hypothetical protein
MSVQFFLLNSNSMLTKPEWLARRLTTQPPEAMIAPESVRTNRSGSSSEIDFISMAHGVALIICLASRLSTVRLNLCLIGIARLYV